MSCGRGCFTHTINDIPTPPPPKKKSVTYFVSDPVPQYFKNNICMFAITFHYYYTPNFATNFVMYTAYCITAFLKYFETAAVVFHDELKLNLASIVL